jgi:hypothetical protein
MSRVVDVDLHLHRTPKAQLNSYQCMDGDGGLYIFRHLRRFVIIVDHLDDE